MFERGGEAEPGLTELKDFGQTTNEAFAFELNSALPHALSPPSMLAIAKEAAASTGNELLTTCLLRGVPNVNTQLASDTFTVSLDADHREYQATGGNGDILDLLKKYLHQLHGLPQNSAITLTPGGRPALDLITGIFSSKTVYVTPDVTYSAVPAILDLAHRRHVTAAVNLDNFDIDEYHAGVIKTIENLKSQGVNSVVFMETLPGNPLGLLYPEEIRMQFLNRLQQMGVVVVVDGFYSTYGDPNSDNFPYNAFRGADSMDGRLFIGGVTKDGDHPNPGLRAAYIVGDHRLIAAAKSIQATAEGGVSSPTQQILAARLGQLFDAHGRLIKDHVDAVSKFAEDTAIVREMARKRLAAMGFTVSGEDENGLGKAGMYLMAETPQGTPDTITGFWEWGKEGIPPGLPLQSFAAQRKDRPQLHMFKPNGTPVDTTRYAHARRIRICIGAGQERVGAALSALEYKIEKMRQTA